MTNPWRSPSPAQQTARTTLGASQAAGFDTSLFMCCLIVRRNKTLGLVQQENHCEKAGVKGNSPTSGYDPIQVEQGAEKLIKAQFWIAKKENHQGMHE